MKKAFVLLLALLLAFSVSATALAATYTDLAGQPREVQDAIYKLSALQIVNGYEDGSWKPDGNITRAEFAKIACLAGGYGNSYQSLNTTVSAFPDVPTGLWYTGWVNLAQGSGYMQGDSQGMFRPDATITENEVLTVLVRLLGYNDHLAGDWPVNYIRQAGSLGLLNDMTFSGNVAAKRSTVALLAADVLEKDMVNWDKNTSSFTPVREQDNTLLDQSFSAAVMDVELEKPVSKQDNVTLGWRYENYEQDAVELVFENAPAMKVTENLQIAGGHAIYDLAGHYGTAIYRVEANRKELLYLELKSTAFSASDLEQQGGRMEIDGKSYSLAKKLRDTDHLIADVMAGDKREDESFLVYLDEDEHVYDILDTRQWADNVGVIDKVTPATGRITYVDTASFGDVVRVLKDKNVVVFKNNVATKGLSPLAAGDVITTVPCAGDNDMDCAILVLPKQSGVFSRMKDRTFTLGETSYQSDQRMFYSFNNKTYKVFDPTNATISKEVRDQIGATATFVLGRNGQVAMLQFGGSLASDTVYGILLDYELSDVKMGEGRGSVSSLKVYNSAGRTVTYEVEPDVYFSEESGKGKSWEVIDQYAHPNTSLLKFKVNAAGKVEEALEVTLTGQGTHWEADKDYSTFDGKDLADDYVAFHIKLGDTDEDIKSVAKLSKTTMLRNKQAVAQHGAYVEDEGDIKVMLFVEFGGANYYQYGIVSDVGFTDSTVDYGVLVIGKSSTKKYDARNKKETAALDLAQGDLISYRVVSSDIDVEQKLIDTSKKFPAGLSPEVQQYSAVLDGISSTRIKVKSGDSTLNYDYDSATLILDYSDFEKPVVMKAADFQDLDKDQFVVALFPDFVNSKYDELLAIVVLERQDGVTYDFKGFE